MSEPIPPPDLSTLTPEQKDLFQKLIDEALQRQHDQLYPPPRVLTPYEQLLDDIDRAVIAFSGDKAHPQDNRKEIEHILLALKQIADFLKDGNA